MTTATGPAPDNPKGHWERAEVVRYHDKILGLLGRAWHSPNHALSLPAGWWAMPRVRAVRNEMIAWLRGQLAERSNFGLKDPRIALLLPVWNEIISELEIDPNFIFCVRAPDQVTRSLATREEMETSDAEYRWVVYNARAIAGIAHRHVCIIRYEDWFELRYATLARLIRHIDLQWEADDIMVKALADEIIDPKLRHDSGAPNMGHTARSLHDAILQSVPGCRFSTELSNYVAAFMGFEQLIAPMHQELVQLQSLRTRESYPSVAIQSAVSPTV